MAQWFAVKGSTLQYLGAKEMGIYKSRTLVVHDFESAKEAKACLKTIPNEYDVEYIQDNEPIYSAFRLWFAQYREQLAAQPKDPVYIAWIEEPISANLTKKVPYGLEVIAPNFGIYKTEQTVPTQSTTNTKGYKGCTVNYMLPREELYATERKSVWRLGYGLSGMYVEEDVPIRNADNKILEAATGEPFPEYSAKVAWSHYRPHMSLPGSADNYTLYALYELSSGYRLGLLPRKDIKEFLKSYATWELIEDTGAKRTYKKDNHTITLKHRVKIEVTQ